LTTTAKALNLAELGGTLKVLSASAERAGARAMYYLGREPTAYFERSGAHVIRDNVTGEVVQISNRLNPSAWKPDSSIVKSVRAMRNHFDIDAEFRGKFVLLAGLRLLRYADARDFIGRCRDAGVRVLGIDAFFERADGVQPSLENSIDYSIERNADLLKDSWQQAELFVREREALSLLFEVVVDRSVRHPKSRNT